MVRSKGLLAQAVGVMSIYRCLSAMQPHPTTEVFKGCEASGGGPGPT